MVSKCLAALDPPQRILVPDSNSVRAEKGVEFFRLTETAGIRRSLPAGIHAAANMRWRTDWQTPESNFDRIRQDGKWYFGVDRRLLKSVDMWLAASGEHFDDRPYGNEKAASVSAFSQSISSVRILRGGGGISAAPWQPLNVNVGAGSVQDRRIGRIRSGLGLWTRAAIDRWNLAGYDQSLTLEYNRETPRDYNNEDLSGRYEIFREFFEGNSNRASLWAGSVERDIYLDAVGQVSRREEQKWGVRDVLTYGIIRGMRVEMAGELLHQKIEQSQADVSASSLEENQAGFSGGLEAEYKRSSADLRLGMRSVTQTIRGDILQGRTTDLSIQGRTSFRDKSTLALRLSVSKYSLDTRSPTNHDDRDELRYGMEGSWSKPVLKTLVCEFHSLVRLDHLVYIFKQNSANNRWTRFFLLGSIIRHSPSRVFQQTARWTVSSDYQDYDFDTDPLRTRSSVHRRLILSDSLALHVCPRLTWSTLVTWQLEEFGRLYWDSFEEEKSDETGSLTIATEYLVNLTVPWRIGAGYLWDSRKGERYTGANMSEKMVFQNLKSYGPTVRLEYTKKQGIFFNLSGRALRQFQLARDDRWLITGEAMGGFRW